MKIEKSPTLVQVKKRPIRVVQVKKYPTKANVGRRQKATKNSLEGWKTTNSNKIGRVTNDVVVHRVPDGSTSWGVANVGSS